MTATQGNCGGLDNVPNLGQVFEGWLAFKVEAMQSASCDITDGGASNTEFVDNSIPRHASASTFGSGCAVVYKNGRILLDVSPPSTSPSQ